MAYKENKQSGAVLLTVLIVLTMLTLLIASAHSILSSRLKLAQQAKALVDSKALVQGKINQLTYLAATQRFTAAGISRGRNKDRLTRLDGQWNFALTYDEYRLDSYPYSEQKGNKTLQFSLQAVNGLIPVNTESDFWLDQWLEGYGINVTNSQKYKDTLLDYIDADYDARAAGAEQMSYPKKYPMPLPTNYFLQDCSELSLMPHWSELIETNPNIINECSTGYSSALNINAIPASLLTKLWPEKKEQILAKREENVWFSSLDNLTLVVNNLDLNRELLYRFSSDGSLIIKVSADSYSETRKVELGTGLLPPFTFFVTSLELGKISNDTIAKRTD